jgi:hypothetical protein
MMCHFTAKHPFHLSCCQYSTLFPKSTGPTISATPQNCPLALTCVRAEQKATHRELEKDYKLIKKQQALVILSEVTNKH